MKAIPGVAVLVLASVFCCMVALAQDKPSRAIKEAEKWLAEARATSLSDDPGEAASQLRQLGGLRALLSSALVNPEVSHHLAVVLADPRRSRGERVMAAYTAVEAQARIDVRRPDFRQVSERLKRIARAKHPDPLLRAAALRVLVGNKLIEKREWLTAYLLSPHAKSPMWTRSHPVDPQMVREVMARLPGDPKVVLSGGDYAPRWHGRLLDFFDERRISISAARYMLQRYPESNAGQQAFLFGSLSSWALYGRSASDAATRRICEQVFKLSVELMRSGEPGRGAEYALGFLMSYNFGPGNARLMAQAARRATDDRWRKMLRDVIRGYVERGKWPKGVSLDGVFEGKQPTAHPPPRTTPRWRKRPAKMISEEHPLLKRHPDLQPAGKVPRKVRK